MSIRIHFAPIQGYTDSVYREIHNEIFGGIDTYYTPFIRIEKGGVRKHDAREFSEERNQSLISEGKLIPQVLPGNAEEMEELTKCLSSNGYKSIDINLGCPFPMIAKKRKGCGMLPYPEEVTKIIDITNKHPQISFSVKMRLGMNDVDEWKLLTTVFNDSNLKRITIHPRIGTQQYKGDINYQVFGEFINEIKVPIVYNGEIKSASDAKRIFTDYPNIENIMIGRGLLKNPNLASEIIGKEADKIIMKEKFLEFNSKLLEKYSKILDGGEPQLIKKVVTIWDYLLPDIEKKDLKRIIKSRNAEDYLRNSTEAIRNLFSSKD